HPLVVMIALIIGGSLLGLLGMVLAIPGAAAVRVLIRHFLLEDNRGGGSEEAVPEADATA
ncbi:MAG: AI-2E family transporter, partial [Bdellovibrionales bacterium]|nr:AI-2E family transporter [Bdellovibrionales bacterium]